MVHEWKVKDRMGDRIRLVHTYHWKNSANEPVSNTTMYDYNAKTGKIELYSKHRTVSKDAGFVLEIFDKAGNTHYSNFCEYAE